MRSWEPNVGVRSLALRRHADCADASRHSPAGRVSNLNPRAVARFRAALGDDLSDDDVFHYVYGILHALDFRSTFESSLKKEKPRVPLVESRAAFDTFATAGRELCALHVGYEAVEPYQITEEWAAGADPDANPDLLLVADRKMSYAKASVPGTGHGKRDLDRSRLRYNDHLTLRSGFSVTPRALTQMSLLRLGHRHKPESTDRSLTGRAAGLPERSAGVPAFAGRCRSEEPSLSAARGR